MLKIGIIGFGRMGITHHAIINSHPNVVVESVVDSSTLVLSIVNKYLPVNTYKDYNELFNKKKTDAILICTPPHLNSSIIVKAAEFGIHVFVEKPFTTKEKDARILTDIYVQKELVNQVGYVNRFNEIFRTVKSKIENGLIGNVIRFKSEMFSSTITQTDESSGWRSSRESGGGAVFEMAAHAIDLVNYLIGKPDKIVGSSLNKIYSKNVEDAVNVTFLYKNGISGTLNVNWSDESYRKPTNKIEIFGSHGRLIADQHSLKIYLNRPNKEHSLIQGWNTLYITDVFEPVPFYVRGNEFTRQLYHFVDCILNKNKLNVCSFLDGKNVLSVIESIFRDFEQNGKI